MAVPTQRITGPVEAANDKGIKVDGRWLNYSQFHQVDRPEVGQVVELDVAKERFINGLRVLGADGSPVIPDGPWPVAEGLRAPEEDDLDPATFGYDGPPRGSAAPRPAQRPAAPPAKGGRATLRAAALAAAAHFLSARPDAGEDDVYSLAYRFLAWIDEGEG